MKKRKRFTGEEIAYNLIAGAIFIIIGFICAYPFYYLLICTISDNKLVEAGAVLYKPVGIHFQNYIEVLKVDNLGNAAIVTVARTVLGTGLSLLVTSYAAYFFTKEEMWHRKIWYRMCIATMYFGAGMIPAYLNNKMLGLVNTFWIYIIPGMLSVYNMILVKTSIEALPPDLEESAYLDGAGYMTRFIRIVLPLQKPILATVALFTAVGHWNDFFTTQLYITNTKLYTLQFLLYELMNQIMSMAQQITEDSAMTMSQVTPTGIRLTLTSFVVIPVMCIYPFIQKYFVKGIMMGAVKG